MKQLILLILTLLLICSSCSGQALSEGRVSSLNETTSINQGDLAAFLSQADMPENFTFDLSLDTVNTPRSARIYSGQEILFDVQTAKTHLLRREIVDTKNYAEGPWFETGDDTFREHLCVYDNAVSKGGLIYNVTVNSIHLPSKLSRVIVDEPGPKEAYGRTDSDLKKSDFQSGSDLDFRSFTEVTAALMQILQKTGFPDMEIAETYSLDLQTMETQYAIFKQELSRYISEEDTATMQEETGLVWSKDDECYLFILRQLIDQIPVMNQSWQGRGATSSPAGNPMPATRADAYWSKDGLIQLSAYNLYSLKESSEPQKLIPPDQAITVLLEDYSRSIITRPTWIKSVELCYVAEPGQDKALLTLIPAWIICVGEQITIIDGTEEMTDENYTFEVIHAIDGVKLSG